MLLTTNFNRGMLAVIIYVGDLTALKLISSLF